MATIHTFILVETMNVNATNRNTLFAAMRAILSQDSSQPAYINHDRVRLDSDAMILCALFDEDDVSVAQMKQYLGTVFDIDPADIGNVNDNQNAYGFESILSYPDGVTDRIRYIAFGYSGGWASWETSRLAVLAYLSDNDTAWEAET